MDAGAPWSNGILMTLRRKHSFSNVEFEVDAALDVKMGSKQEVYTLSQLYTLALYFFSFVTSMSSSTHSTEAPVVYSSFNKKAFCSPLTRIQEPENINSLWKVVKLAIREGHPVKAFGALHTTTDMICTNGIPISMKKINHATLNEDGTATFGAGIELADAMNFLEHHNLTLHTLPAYGRITIGGAIGTGAHGSSLRHPATISDQVVRLTAIGGNGTILRINSTDDVNAYKVHLGLLGVIVDVTVRTIPLVKMTAQNKLQPDSCLFDGSALKEAKNYDMYQIWWFPNSCDVVVGVGNYVPVHTPGNASSNFIFNELRFGVAKTHAAFEFLQGTRNTMTLDVFAEFAKRSLFEEVFGKPPIYSEDGERLQNPATGFAWRLQSSSCTSEDVEACSWDNNEDSIYPEENSFSFDLSEFSEVMNVIKKAVSEHPSFSLLGFFIRFQKASTGLMSISAGRDSFSVGWLTPRRVDPYNNAHDGVGTFQALMQQLVFKYGGRPHWGKNGLYFFTQNILRDKRLVPNRETFISAMKKFDPENIFRNKFGDRILGISDDMDKSPKVERCAIGDYCVCTKANDCAISQICSKLNGFRVCKDIHRLNARPIDFHKLSNVSDILETINKKLYQDGEFKFRQHHCAIY